MKYQDQVVEALFLKRNNRFIGEVTWKSETFPVHIPNTGSLKGVLDVPQPCRIRQVLGKQRKVPWSLEMLKVKKNWVGVNTQWPNHLIRESWECKKLFQEYPYSQGEVKINSSSRIDRVFWKEDIQEKLSEKLFKKHSFHFVEIKNVSFSNQKTALFPDAPTTRGQKHLRDLQDLLKQGHTCEMVYVVQREDCVNFSCADDIDPVYGEELRRSIELGLKVSVFSCKLSPSSIELKTDSLLSLQI